MASPPGSSFYPQDHHLLTQYLLPKIAGRPLPAATQHFFIEADVYVDDPETLTSSYPPGPARVFGESPNWYFFSPVKADIARDGRKPRIVGGGKGTWKAERGEEVLEPVEGRPVGRLDRFTYIPKPKQQGKPSEWLMVEFSLDQDGGEPNLVLCKIYRSPRFMKAASRNSTVASACKSKPSARKRKAAVSPASSSASARKTPKVTGESSAVRRQLFFPEPVTDEAFLGKNGDSVSQQLRSPSPSPSIRLDFSPESLSAWGRKNLLPAPNSVSDAAFLGKNTDCVTQQLRSPPSPIPLGEEAIFGDDQFWSEYSIDELPEIPAAPISNAPYPLLGEEPYLGDDQFRSGSCEHSDPSPTPPADGTFVGDNSNSTRLLQFPSPPAANSTAEVHEQMVRYLAGDNNWEEQRNCIGQLPATPWLCSMTVPPLPFCSGINFCGSIAAP